MAIELIKRKIMWDKHKLLYCSLVFMLVVIFLSWLSEKKQNNEINKIETADTVIPFGHVLVPIDIINSEALGSMVGGYAIVDLFSQGKKVGKKLKILRAPLNPEKYAVLIREEESSLLMQAQGPFFAVIQSPYAKGYGALSKQNRRGRLEFVN